VTTPDGAALPADGEPGLEAADASTAAAAPPSPADAPPLGPIDWLKVNGPVLLLVAAGIVWLGVKTGPMGLWRGFLVVVGIGFVIFVHELGHFLAAKWCDVHVTTFSIGFGPAIPGCSFRRGETLYKLALLPLGGYVNMVGEGPEADEDENYPRSFKNKSVGQRMLIISAGVVMNVLLGFFCYILVYRFHGEPRLPAVIGSVDPGTPAWKAGVPSGTRIDDVNGHKDPFWETLTIEVMSAPAGRSIPFVFEKTDHETIAVDLTPRLDPTDDKPVIGVRPASRLRLYPSLPAGDDHPPVRLESPAAAARVVDLRPGDKLLAASDPAGGDALTDLPADPHKALAELGRRLRALAGKPVSLKVLRKGGDKPETVAVASEGFSFEDDVIGTSDAGADPLEVKSLPPDPFADPTTAKKEDPRDVFEYQNRMKRLAGKSALIQVRRHSEPAAGASEPPKEATVLVPPAYHRTLGLRMTFGKVTAVRTGSPAERAGVQEGDQLTKVVLTTPAGSKEFKAADVDPAKLPTLLAAATAGSPGPKRVVLTVVRPDKRNEEKQLDPVDWDDSRDYSEEQAMLPRVPLSVPQLGLAYLIVSTATAVEPGSPAALAGALPGDTVVGIRFHRPPEKKGKEPKWGEWMELKDKARYDPGDACEQWAYVDTALQTVDDSELQLKVQGADGKLVYLPGRTAEVPDGTFKPVEDPSWPLDDRGLSFQPDVRLQKTDNTATALLFGLQRTGDFIREILLNLRALATRRVSPKSIGGPIAITAMAFSAAQDPFALLGFLGMISVNLAVVNFLPIPLLDGGHMMFLIYEKLRGRRPSETVQTVATVGGLVFLLSLMLFILYQDAGTFGIFRWLKQLLPGK
jgi:regulator of sigma E protease